MEQSVNNVQFKIVKVVHQLLEHNILVLLVDQDTLRQMTPLVLHALLLNVQAVQLMLMHVLYVKMDILLSKIIQMQQYV
jgi:hypothetical protein